VIGYYFRWKDKTINMLRRWANEITTGLRTQTNAASNFLIGGSSGGGKTYLAEQIAAACGAKCVRIDFKDKGLTHQRVLELVLEVRNATVPVLVLLDEVDTPSAEPWLFDDTFDLLEIKKRDQSRQVVCILTGSATGGAKEVHKYLKTRTTKAKDLGTRVLRSFDVPDAIFEDQLAVLAAQVKKNLSDLDPSVHRICKVAAYYILSDPKYLVPRHLRDLIEDAVGRMKKRGGSEGLLYSDLESAGNIDVLFSFWADHRAAADSLASTFIELE
jgi:hypothetical protein